MGSLVDELQRREAVARAEAERLRGQIAELAERLAGVEEQLSRLVIAREVVDEVLDGAATAELSPVPGQLEVPASPGAGHPPVTGGWRCRRGGPVLRLMCCRGITGTCWRWLEMRGGRCVLRRLPRRRG
jgi:hypothetical protein